ncbi:MAG: hydrogenase formation protein HypD [Candidatus Omnitrophica bacterium CG1_02_44_16]|nr:MAG: hydrogenase formation protein HypD [Candidatus Omnitrophica bacterium CG1_02_44_16]PIY82488.1 MAG: hydrogenase formation protein HypD [Candidatus Omnitrophica bacterium CG_4_10_14_0_8_um_filter_44_12]PIZ84504.1 MAG: hydrogenase formation protein HypD [Candidatus Omnitrophica bacterium CG_4_10_14_0_2_um_filter_44_9]
MKYIDEYRDPKKVRRLVDLINSEVVRPVYKIMEVCGTHTAAIRRFGIKSMLSQKIELISGPGCPVCVTSDGYLKNALFLARHKDIVITTYPDMLRVPADGESLETLRSEGADIRGVNSALDALDIARRLPKKEVVFLAVGFETTAPGTAIALETAKKEKLRNFSVYSAHKTIPEALIALGEDRELALNGFLLPGHVSAIIGVSGYARVFKKIALPSVITGFESSDILFAIYRIVKAVNDRRPILENEYTRIVRNKGNTRAKALLKKAFIQKDSLWRGLGVIKNSGLFVRSVYSEFDAQKKYNLKNEVKNTRALRAARGCLCADVLKGKIAPTQCPFFGKSCTPLAPKGPCMVSREGTCRSYFEYQ